MAPQQMTRVSMAQSKLTAFAPAKINLTLSLLGKRRDGYHELESLVVFADVGDRLAATPSDDWGLDVNGPFAPGLAGENPQDNLVICAARVVHEWARAKGADVSPLRFQLEKKLPVASGIGGGSADAAAAIKLCLQSAGLDTDDDLVSAAAALGADIPVCLMGQPAWMGGVGDKLSLAQTPTNIPMVLVNPGIGISTGEIFQRLNADPVTEQGVKRPDLSSFEGLIEYLESSGNDLEKPALELAPVIGIVLEAIASSDAAIARMSGSGATCFGIYQTQDEATIAAEILSASHPEWWVSSQ